MDCCFFVDPDLDSESANVFWVEPTDPHILSCNLLPLGYQKPCLKLVLNDIACDYSIKTTFDDECHMLVYDQNGCIQFIFDQVPNFECSFSFSINLISSVGLAQKGDALVSLEHLLNYGHFKHSDIPYPLNKFASRELLYAYDLWKIGLSQREIGLKIYGNAAILDGWDGVSDNIRTRTRRLISRSRELVAAGALTFLEVD